MSNLQSNHCNLKNPEKFTDVAIVDQMELLPIRSVFYGPLTYETQQAAVTVTSLNCFPNDSESESTMLDQVIENEARIDSIEQETTQMREELKKIEHIQEDIVRHDGQLEKLNSTTMKVFDNILLEQWLSLIHI